MNPESSDLSGGKGVPKGKPNRQAAPSITRRGEDRNSDDDNDENYYPVWDDHIADEVAEVVLTLTDKPLAASYALYNAILTMDAGIKQGDTEDKRQNVFSAFAPADVEVDEHQLARMKRHFNSELKKARETMTSRCLVDIFGDNYDVDTLEGR